MPVDKEVIRAVGMDWNGNLFFILVHDEESKTVPLTQEHLPEVKPFLLKLISRVAAFEKERGKTE